MRKQMKPLQEKDLGVRINAANWKGGDTVTRISTAAYQIFDRPSRASEYERVISLHDTGNP